MPGTVMSRFSYPKVPGDSLQSVLDLAGPASYAVIVPGASPSGGQTVNATDFGLQSIDFVASIGSSNGTYQINIIPVGFSLGNPLKSVLVQWIVGATGAEATAATNLSGATLRLMAFGR